MPGTILLNSWQIVKLFVHKQSRLCSHIFANTTLVYVICFVRSFVIRKLSRYLDIWHPYYIYVRVNSASSNPFPTFSSLQDLVIWMNNHHILISYQTLCTCWSAIYPNNTFNCTRSLLFLQILLVYYFSSSYLDLCNMHPASSLTKIISHNLKNFWPWPNKYNLRSVDTSTWTRCQKC